MEVSIPKYPIDSFTWSRWRLGEKVWRELGVACRTQSIKDNSSVLRQYVIGYREGDKIFCRPKIGEFAVLFIIDNVYCWTHFRKEEFNYVFCK